MTYLGWTRCLLAAAGLLGATGIVVTAVGSRLATGWILPLETVRLAALVGVFVTMVVSLIVTFRSGLAVTASGLGAPGVLPVGLPIMLLVGPLSGASFPATDLSRLLIWPTALLAGTGLVFARLCWTYPVVLTPAGVRAGWFGPRRFVAWEALAADDPIRRRPSGRWELVVERAPGPGDRPGTVVLPPTPQAALLAGAIRWYVEHPEDRAAISRPGEVARLTAVWEAVPGTVPLAASRPTGDHPL